MPDFPIGQYEILIRLATVDEPVLSPGEFLPEAESLNLIQQIDHWVIEHAIQRTSECPSRCRTRLWSIFRNRDVEVIEPSLDLRIVPKLAS